MNLAKRLIGAFMSFPYAGHSTTTRRPYDGDELRAIRKRKGVGRPPAVWRAREERRFSRWCQVAAQRSGCSCPECAPQY
jgi:hypothetical protein